MSFGFGFGMPRIFSASRAFNPASLFANGEQGWWYDPSNFSTLFQDSAGTTPVTAVEQPVGLQLDLSKGAPATGPELVVNGTFDANTPGPTVTGWSSNVTAPSTAAVVANKFVVTTSTATGFGRQNQILTLVVGQTYKITCTLRAVSGTLKNSFFYLGIASGGFGAAKTATNSTTVDTTYVGFFTATQATNYLVVGDDTAALDAVTEFDNISVKAVPGNHRFQTTSANRPVVSARVNLLTKTEQFQDTGVWPQNGTVVVTPNANTAPDGTVTADLLDHTGGFSGVFQTIASVPAAVTYRASIAYKYIDGQVDLRFRPQGTSAPVGVDLIVNTQNNSVISSSGVSNVMFTPQDQGYTRVSFDVTTATSGSLTLVLYRASGGQARNYVWGADLRPTNQGVNLPAYQRVNTSTDYDSTGFPTYIKPNGSNQFMVTNSINFTATDKMTVWQGVRKLGTTSSFLISNISGSFTQGFEIGASTTAASDYRFGSAGSIYVAVEPTGFSAPITNVLTGIADISGDVATLRVNGVQAATSSANQGTGNYGTFATYFYARSPGSAQFFNGHDYGSIARGAASTAAQITAGETYINSKTKAY